MRSDGSWRASLGQRRDVQTKGVLLTKVLKRERDCSVFGEGKESFPTRALFPVFQLERRACKTLEAESKLFRFLFAFGHAKCK